MKTWLRQHAAASVDAAKQILSAPGNFFFNVLVTAFALSLPIAGLTLIENVRPISSQLSIAPELSLFLKTDLSRSNATAFADTIKKLIKTTPAKVVFIPRETALAALQNSSGLGDVLTTLGDNPLPDAYVLSFEEHFELTTQQSSPEKIEALAAQLQKLPEVDHVQIDSNWIKRLAALMHLAQFVLAALAIALSVVVITVVFNATRLQVLSHRAEIVVIRLLGATSQYIRRPYYYTGALLGLAAGLTALAIVAAALQPMNQAIVEFASLYGSEFHLTPLNLTFSVYLLVSSALLGLFGAFLSVRHQVKQLN
ncbi:cell division protein FtsX [Solimicrobium silvestre]|uniref:Cell division protein FtsX n=1 Tax=Solimicrobium silvestre TaxID=2099400 RepID=A0A2S9H145_9BURK|nr:permease-like cell division protein FtsX [Solimicrobium silvestre]PRC93688.1 Cell division protein [Solimicrobium silvestre]